MAEQLIAQGSFKDALAKLSEAAARGELEESQVLINNELVKFQKSGKKEGEAYMLLALAENNLARQEAVDALKYAKDARAITASLGNKEADHKVLLALVNAYLMKDSPMDAKRTAKEMLVEAQKIGDKAAEAEAWLALAKAHLSLEVAPPGEDPSTPEDALDAAQKGLALFKDMKLARGEGTALTTIAEIRLKMENAQAGLNAAKDAVEVCRSLTPKMLVAALEFVVQAYSMQASPMEGIRAIHKELEMMRSSGNKAGEAQVLEQLATTHATLLEPIGAQRNATMACDIYRGLGDKMGEAVMLHLMAEMQRANGQKAEATKTAEKALKLFKAMGLKWGEDQAVQTISSLLVERGHPEKAPKRDQAMKVLKDLVRAIEARKTQEVQELEEKLSGMGGLITNEDVQTVLAPALQRDPAAMDFLEEQGWQFEHEKGDATRIKSYPHRAFYVHMIMTGMNFGPQFRVVNPYKVFPQGPKDMPIAISVSQLPETEAWQMEMGYRPGVLDSGLQCQASLAFP